MNKSINAIRRKRFVLLRQWHRKLSIDLQRVQRSCGVEAVHDARVGARRLRVVLKALRKECHPVLVSALLFDLRDIGRALAPVRDADVRNQRLLPLARRAHDANKRDHDRLLTILKNNRTGACHMLKPMMRDAAWQSRLQRITTHITDGTLFALPHDGRRLLLEHQALDRHLASIRKKLAKKHGGKEELHSLRIKVKHARYLVNFLADSGATPRTVLMTHLKNLQTTLGNMHDDLQLDGWLDQAPGIGTSLKHRLRESLRGSVAEGREQLAEFRKRVLLQSLTA